MKTKQNQPIKLFEGGKNAWERTGEYRTKVAHIVDEVTEKYATILLNENRWIKRLQIKLRIMIEIRKRINELSSIRNLHIGRLPLSI